jgi:hypothetical protein
MKLKKRRGVALIAVLLVLSSLFVLTMGFAAFTANDYLISQSNYSSVSTFYLAQAGLEYFAFLMKHNMLIYPITKLPLRKIPHPVASGGIVNVFTDHDDTDDHGQTHLVISDLSWGPVDDIFGTTRACGCFRVHGVEMADDIGTDNNNRVLYVQSIGMIKEIIPAGGDPTTWEYWDDRDNAFPIRAQRTLEMRIPFAQRQHLKIAESGSDFTEPDSDHAAIYQEIMSDGWVERYR